MDYEFEKIDRKRLKCSLFVFLFGILSISTVYAINTRSEGYKAVFQVEQTIDEWDVCKEVDNQSTYPEHNDVFVPTATSNEWLTFISGKPDYVNLEDCCMPDCEGKNCGGDGCGGSCGVCGWNSCPHGGRTCVYRADGSLRSCKCYECSIKYCSSNQTCQTRIDTCLCNYCVCAYDTCYFEGQPPDLSGLSFITDWDNYWKYNDSSVPIQISGIKNGPTSCTWCGSPITCDGIAYFNVAYNPRYNRKTCTFTATNEYGTSTLKGASDGYCSGQDVWTHFVGFSSSFVDDLTRVVCPATCYKTSCSGWSNKVFFTPESSSRPRYYATCLGSWTADVREATWGSTCPTGWQDIEFID